MADGDLCKFPACTRSRKARGYCKPHYQQWRANPDQMKPLRWSAYPLRGAICEGPGCERLARAHRLCIAHAQQRQRGHELGPIDGKHKGLDRDPKRFIDQHTVRDSQSGCWEWPAAKRYPVSVALRTRVPGATTSLVHRLAYMVYIGPIPTGQVVHHACGLSRCVNPAHLQLVTHAANLAEMHARRAFIARISELEDALRSVDPAHPLLVGQPEGAWPEN